MRYIRLMGLLLVFVTQSVVMDGVALASVPSSAETMPTRQAVTATLMGMPLQFEANHGQVDAPVKFLARGKGYTLFLTPTESVMVLRAAQARGNGHEAMGPESLLPRAQCLPLKAWCA